MKPLITSNYIYNNQLGIFINLVKMLVVGSLANLGPFGEKNNFVYLSCSSGVSISGASTLTFTQGIFNFFIFINS